jgi:hypothetical protein
MSFNPLEQLAKRKASKQAVTAPRFSTEPAPEPVPDAVFDTTTPAVSTNVPRRFDLGDLPGAGANLYPYLKKAFPHLHERMYGGWLRGCIQDNTCHFTVIDGEAGRTVGMAFMEREAVNPIPYVDIKFVFGQPVDFPAMYADIVQWAKNLDASRVQQDQYDTDELAGYLPDLKLEKRLVTVLDLKA